MRFSTRVADDIEDIRAAFSRLKEQAPAIEAGAAILIEALQADGKVMFCGNGGSAADSQHLAAELSGRYMKNRPALAGLALTVDTSALTAIGNDFSFDHVFSRQVAAYGRPGDALVAISTSGNSGNVVAAIAAARERGIRVVGLTGAGGGRMADLCDVIVKVPHERTNHIQEMHIAVGHIWCGLIEEALFP